LRPYTISPRVLTVATYACRVAQCFPNASRSPERQHKGCLYGHTSDLERIMYRQLHCGILWHTERRQWMALDNGCTTYTATVQLQNTSYEYMLIAMPLVLQLGLVHLVGCCFQHSRSTIDRATMKPFWTPSIFINHYSSSSSSSSSPKSTKRFAAALR